jgi:hypothetical protein
MFKQHRSEGGWFSSQIAVRDLPEHHRPSSEIKPFCVAAVD